MRNLPPDSWKTLDQFQSKLNERVLNKLEDRMLHEHRDQITDEDVRICVYEAMQELIEMHERGGDDRQSGRAASR